MKLIDRLTGKTTEAPEIIQSGRYRMLEKAVINKHTELPKGKILFSDGALNCHLDKQQFLFEKNNGSDVITSDSILTISELLQNTIDTNVSPLLPSALINNVNELSSLEKLLEAILKKGHLHHISSQPRIDLRYDEAVIDVSRAKRLSSNTLKHLASHSECWQQRTLTGVIPRKVLAKLSEDDYEVYENRLYARLLDKLDTYLSSRLTLVNILYEELENALNFQTSDEVYFQLSRKICSLWAKTYSDEQTEKQIEASKALKEKIEAFLLSIKRLKQGGLYTLISHHQVGGEIHRTNILMHDPHYQQLPRLWDSIQAETTVRNPEEVFAHEENIHNAYVKYVGLVISYALEKYKINDQKTFLYGGEKYTLTVEKDEWIITDSSNTNSLDFIPWASSNLPTLGLTSNKVICWFGFNELTKLDDDSFQSSHIPVSPLDLYVVERMGKLIDTWLLKKIVQPYMNDLSPIPEKLSKKLTDFDEIIETKQGIIKILKPLSKSKEVRRIIQESDANDETKNKIKNQIELVEELANCPICHIKSGHFNPDKIGFVAECRNCKSQWSMDGKTYRQYIKGTDKSFKVTGRFFIKFDY